MSFAGTAEMLNGLFPILATEYAGLSPAQAGIVYAVSTLATIFSGPVFGWLSDNVSRKLVLMVRGAANTLSSTSIGTIRQGAINTATRIFSSLTSWF